jgi:hypothetical protein
LVSFRLENSIAQMKVHISVALQFSVINIVSVAEVGVLKCYGE